MIVLGPQYQQKVLITTPNPKQFGRGLSAGDVNRDGVNDLVIGDPELDLGSNTATGKVSIYYGPDFTTIQSFWGAHPQAEFGTGILVVDVDQDGFAEIFIGGGGEFGGSLHRYRHATFKALDLTDVSLAAGGSVRLSIEVGALSKNSTYLVLASASGTSPGVDIPYGGQSVHLPLNFDAVSSWAIPLANSPVFQGFLGTTDATGNALATLLVPPGIGAPSLAGLTLSFAAVVAKPSGVIEYATDAVQVTLKL